MIRLDLMREAFDSAMLEVIERTGLKYQWLGVNANLTPDNAKLIVISGFQPGRTVSAELGGPEAAVIRDGVYIVTLSIPSKKDVSPYWEIAGEIEQKFRRKNLDAHTCAVWCDEPYTENRGTEPETGRFLISTTVPWSVVH